MESQVSIGCSDKSHHILSITILHHTSVLLFLGVSRLEGISRVTSHVERIRDPEACL